MESAPLNLAHFHERRAERHVRRNRYDEAIKAMETALVYIEDAYKTVSIPKAIQVLDAQKWDCSRKLKQINIRQSQHEGLRISAKTDPLQSHNRQAILPQSDTTPVQQNIENINPQYHSTTAEELNKNTNRSDNNNVSLDLTNWMDELESKGLPALAPLELPTFDIGLDNSPMFEDHE